MGDDDFPDLEMLQGVVAPEILNAVRVASARLREAGIPHALAGGLAIGAHGYPRTTDDVDFLVGDEAFEHHAGGIVTLRLPLIAIGNVRVDFVSLNDSPGEREQSRNAVAEAGREAEIPITPMPALVYMKLKAGRQKDIADLVELLKRGRIDIDVVERYLAANAPQQMRRWQHAKETAAREE